MHALPNADTVCRLHADEHGCQGIVDQADYSTRAAPWVCLTIARDALRGFDLDNDGVPLSGATNTHCYGFALIEAEGEGNSGNRSNFHGLSRMGVVWCELWLILLGMACLQKKRHEVAGRRLCKRA